MAPGGRSTGCRTCRMRHLKCDEDRPNCQRCVKAGVECRGYDVIDIFVDERSRIHERGSKARQGQRNAADASLSHRPKAAAARASRKKPAAVATSSSASTPQSSARASPSIRAEPSPSTNSPIATLDNDVFLNFMRHELFPRPNIFKDQYRQLRTTTLPGARAGWLRPALTQAQLKPPLEPAVNALSRAWFGKRKGQPDVAAQGMFQYGKALSELKIALSNDRWRERDVLICAMCLIIYEALVLTDEDAWVNHARGLAQLVEAQGPESFQDLAGIGIIRAIRHVVIMSALIREVPSFLEKEEWRSLLWQSHPSAKDDNDRLFEIFATAPRLMQEISRWESEQTVDPTPILRSINNSLHELCTWRWKYEMDHTNCAWIEDFLDEAPSDIFPHTLQFATLYDAHVIGHFDGLLILFLWLAARLNVANFSQELSIPQLPETVEKKNPLILPGVDKLDIVVIAREVCQIIRFRTSLASANSDNSVVFSLFLPIDMVMNALKDFPAEYEWLGHVAKDVEQSTGIQFSKLVYSARRRDK